MMMLALFWTVGLASLLGIYFFGKGRKRGAQIVWGFLVLLVAVSAATVYSNSWIDKNLSSQVGHTVLMASPFLFPGFFLAVNIRKKNDMAWWAVICAVVALALVSSWVAGIIVSNTGLVGGK